MSDTLPAQHTQAADIMERVLAVGDLKLLTPEERVLYYNAVCRSVGLNPLTRPFEYINLNGKLVLYARRDAADQLRQIHNISLEVLDRKQVSDILIVTVRATTPTGRKDEDFGAVSVANLKGEALANQMLKAITKGKRRVTLSICGLGMLDETEVDSIPIYTPHVGDQLDDFATAHDPATGEVMEADVSARLDRAHDVFAELDYAAKAATKDGMRAFEQWWKSQVKADRELISAHLPEYKRLAQEADASRGLSL